jgi:hypothetical protein
MKHHKSQPKAKPAPQAERLAILQQVETPKEDVTQLDLFGDSSIDKRASFILFPKSKKAVLRNGSHWSEVDATLVNEKDWHLVERDLPTVFDTPENLRLAGYCIIYPAHPRDCFTFRKGNSKTYVQQSGKMRDAVQRVCYHIDL